MTSSMPEKTAPETADAYQGDERRDGPKDRRQTDKDRRGFHGDDTHSQTIRGDVD